MSFPYSKLLNNFNYSNYGVGGRNYDGYLGRFVTYENIGLYLINENGEVNCHLSNC